MTVGLHGSNRVLGLIEASLAIVSACLQTIRSLVSDWSLRKAARSIITLWKPYSSRNQFMETEDFTASTVGLHTLGNHTVDRKQSIGKDDPRRPPLPNNPGAVIIERSFEVEYSPSSV